MVNRRGFFTRLAGAIAGVAVAAKALPAAVATEPVVQELSGKAISAEAGIFIRYIREWPWPSFPFHREAFTWESPEALAAWQRQECFMEMIRLAPTPPWIGPHSLKDELSWADANLSPPLR